MIFIYFIHQKINLFFLNHILSMAILVSFRFNINIAIKVKLQFHNTNLKLVFNNT